ncbi:metallophosphoesterase [candidate division WOR-3 bacterium]|nr:metallophosphoesterase [candidate division WOR-3 bacterium]
MRDKRTTIIALAISLGSILIAQVQGTWEQTATSFKDSEDLMGRGGSWETDWTNDGVGTLDSDHPLAEFVLHTIGDPSKPLIYSFYLIADPHIGDFGACSGIFDYNKPKWDPHFDQDYGEIGGPSGGQIGRYLDAAVQLINQHYNHGDGDGRFCIILGDLAATAEIAETEHAKFKLDSLDCPWVPIIGNHDTWPLTKFNLWGLTSPPPEYNQTWIERS